LAGNNVRGLWFFDLILHAITLALDGDRFGVVQHSIQDRGSQGGVLVEDFGPVLVGLIGRDESRSAFIALAKDLEEQVGADLIDGQIA